MLSQLLPGVSHIIPVFAPPCNLSIPCKWLALRIFEYDWPTATKVTSSGVPAACKDQDQCFLIPIPDVWKRTCDHPTWMHSDTRSFTMSRTTIMVLVIYIQFQGAFGPPEYQL